MLKNGGNFGNEKYWFKTFKVYWAFKWWIAKEIDERMAVTPIKTNLGFEIQKTNYAEKYL